MKLFVETEITASWQELVRTGAFRRLTMASDIFGRRGSAAPPVLNSSISFPSTAFRKSPNFRDSFVDSKKSYCRPFVGLTHKKRLTESQLLHHHVERTIARPIVGPSADELPRTDS